MSNQEESSSPKAKLMLLALAAPQNQLNPEDSKPDELLVVFIGVERDPEKTTTWAQEVWRVGIARVSDFKRFLEGRPKDITEGGQAREGGEWHTQSLFQAFSSVGAYTHVWATSPDIAEIGISDGEGGETEKRFHEKGGTNRLWIDRIYRIYLFRGEEHDKHNEVWHGCGHDQLLPLLKLDTAAWVVNGNPKTKDQVVTRKWVVSRLRLDSEESWRPEGDDSGRMKARKLNGYRLVAHIPLAVNSHLLEPNVEDGIDKRFDTRAVLIASSKFTETQTTLWGKPEFISIGQQVEEVSFPHFTQLNLAFSEANGFSGDRLNNENLEQDGITPRSLSELISDHKGPNSKNAPVFVNQLNNTEAGLRADVPILADIPGFTKRPTELLKDQFRLSRRELGFRTLQISPFKVGLRAESQFKIGSARDWKNLWDCLVKPVVSLDCPEKGLVIGPNESALSLSQEQLLLKDLSVDLERAPTEPVSWLLSVRIESETGESPIDKLVLDRISSIAEDINRGLGNARATSGLTLLPSIEVSGIQASMPWHLVGLMKVSGFRRRIHLNIKKEESTWSLAADQKGRIIQFESLQPIRSRYWSSRSEGTASVGIRKGKGWLLDTSGVAIWGNGEPPSDPQPTMTLTASASDELSTKPPALQPVLGIPDGSVHFQLTQTNDAGKGKVFQIGSLQFTIAQSPALRFIYTLHPGLSPQIDLVEQIIQDRLEYQGEMLLRSFRPTSQDPLPQSAHASADSGLILELPPPNPQRELNQNQHEQPLKLWFKETAGGTVDQAFTARLIAQPTDQGARDLNPLLVIDPQPWRVVLVQGVRLDTEANGNELAIYQPGEDGRFSWQIIDPRQTQRLRLPPQALGEAMERTRTRPGGLDDISTGKPVPMRFGSITEVEIDPTFRDTSVREAGWNLRRILNRISDSAPGALLRSLRLELTYGMVTSMTSVDSERQVWITEMCGVIGRAASPPDKKPNSPTGDYRAYLHKVVEAQARRLAVDKLWSGRPEHEFHNRQGLQFSLRTNDKYEANAENPNFKLRYPAPLGSYPKENDSVPSAKVVLSTFGVDQPSFPGGITWAVESKNVLLELYRQQKSSLGRISDLHLSALGGWGKQRAEFDKTVFETDSSMGRLQTYRLERIGRIGALYNRAKHVVIYQRSVVPSDQFKAAQDPLLGQPVLRKSDEYIEILEPEYRFTIDSSSSESGCLLGSRFLTTRIRVDGLWGQDVRDEGWMIPIWKRTEKQDLALYPPPQVKMIMVGEDGKEREIEVVSVEKLVFYTSTSPNETAASISTWHPVEGIDYCDLPAPQVKETRYKDLENERQRDLHDGFLPSPAAVPAGYDRLTLELSSNSVPIQITAGRTESGPSAPLRTITISRAVPLPLPTGESILSYGIGAAQLATDIRGVYDRLLGRIMGRAEQLRQQGQLDTETIKAELTNCLSSMSAEINKLGDAMKKQSDDLQQTLPVPKLDQGDYAQQLLNHVRSRITICIQAEGRWMLMEGHRLAMLKLDRWRQYTLDAKVLLLQSREKLTKLIIELGNIQLGGTLELLKSDLIQMRAEQIAAILVVISTLRKEMGNVLDPLLLARFDFFSLNIKPRAALIDVSLLFEAYVSVDRTADTDLQKRKQAELKQLIETINTQIYEGLSDNSDNTIRMEFERKIPSYADFSTVLKACLTRLIGDDFTFALLSLEFQKILNSIEINRILNAVIADEVVLGDIQSVLTQQLEPARTQVEDLLVSSLPKANAELSSCIDTLSTIAISVNDRKTGQPSLLDEIVKNKIITVLNVFFDRDLVKQTLSLDIPAQLECIKASRIQSAISDIISNLNVESTQETLASLKELAETEVSKLDKNLNNRLVTLQRAVGALDQRIDKYQSTYQRGDNLLHLLRAVGDPPKAEGLVINRPEVAYVFDLAKPFVDLTPSLALANRAVATARSIDQAADAASDLLQPFGVRLPIKGLAEDFLPDVLGKISLAKLIPDMAGLKLDALLPSLELPDLGDKVKITRGFDKTMREAWLNADIDIPLGSSTSLLAIGPLTLLLEDGRIKARSRMSVKADGTAHSESNGMITGNWRLVSGGLEVITFQETPLVFDQSGKLDFKLSSNRIKLSPQLQFITSLLESIGKSAPPGVEPVLRDGIPSGVLCRLSMNLPPMNSGVFGITDLTLGSSFGVYAYPDFEIATSLDISTRQSPFTLSVWLLNGGGYISMQLRYLPMLSPPLVVYSLDVAIVAGIGIGFAFGLISGGVWLQVGCSVAMSWSTGSAAKVTTVTVFVLARGSVDVAGLVTAGINLLMEASYDGNDMVASGCLRMSFRISFFYTLKVKESVKYRLKGGSRPRDPTPDYTKSYA